MSSGYINLPLSGGGVTSLNTQTGALTLVAGSNITITPGSGTLTIAGTSSALTIGTFDSGTPNANGAHIDSGAIIMQSASATVPGLINLSTQTIKGNKSFDGNVLSLTDGSNTIGGTATNRFASLNTTSHVAVGVYPIVGGQSYAAITAGSFPGLGIYAGASNGYSIYSDGSGLAFRNIGTAGMLFQIPGSSFSFNNEGTNVPYFSGNASNIIALGDIAAATMTPANGATGTFTSADAKTITVTNGIITSIV